MHGFKTVNFVFVEEFVAHGENVTCLALGRKSGRVMVTGGDDKKVNLWAVGRPNCIMVILSLENNKHFIFKYAKCK